MSKPIEIEKCAILHSISFNQPVFQRARALGKEYEPENTTRGRTPIYKSGYIAMNTSDATLLDCANYEIEPGEYYLVGLHKCRSGELVETYRWAIVQDSLEATDEAAPIR